MPKVFTGRKEGPVGEEKGVCGRAWLGEICHFPTKMKHFAKHKLPKVQRYEGIMTHK